MIDCSGTHMLNLVISAEASSGGHMTTSALTEPASAWVTTFWS